MDTLCIFKSMLMKKVQYDFGRLIFFERYCICIIDDGVHFQDNHFEMVYDAIRKKYGNNNFGYIWHRVNSFSIDPLVYLSFSSIPNLVAIAVVSKECCCIMNSMDVEKLFFKGCFEHFESLVKAQKWINSFFSATNREMDSMTNERFEKGEN